MNQLTAKANEPFFVVDDQDVPAEPLPRRLVHGHGVWHRVAHVWLLNGKKEVLCQQRSFDKELNPGCWEGFFGGHLSPGETYQFAALRELKEETGVDIGSDELQQWRVYKQLDPSGYNNEFQGIFLARWDGQVGSLHFDDGEVARVEWRSIREVQNAMSGSEEKWSNCGYEPELLEYLQSDRAV